MTTVIKGQPTSAEIRKQLKDMGLPVLLQFSCGKDSIATWLALRDSGVDVVPVYLHPAPGMKFIQDELDYFSEFFGKEIQVYPHITVYRNMGKHMVQQSPNRVAVLGGWDYSKLDEKGYWDKVRQVNGLPAETFVADGVRACDSPVRRVAFSKHGIIRKSLRKVSPIADWTTKEVYQAIEDAGIKLPVDYEIFGRSFDGSDYRFTKPLKEHFPEDYALLLKMYPLLEADIFRHEQLGEHNA